MKEKNKKIFILGLVVGIILAVFLVPWYRKQSGINEITKEIKTIGDDNLLSVESVEFDFESKDGFVVLDVFLNESFDSYDDLYYLHEDIRDYLNDYGFDSQNRLTSLTYDEAEKEIRMIYVNHYVFDSEEYEVLNDTVKCNGKEVYNKEKEQSVVYDKPYVGMLEEDIDNTKWGRHDSSNYINGKSTAPGNTNYLAEYKWEGKGGVSVHRRQGSKVVYYIWYYDENGTIQSEGEL